MGGGYYQPLKVFLIVNYKIELFSAISFILYIIALLNILFCNKSCSLSAAFVKFSCLSFCFTEKQVIEDNFFLL